MKTARFEFDSTVALGEAELTLNLATYAAEGLVAPAKIRLAVSHRTDYSGHAITIEGNGEPFDAVIRVYTGLLTREFGECAFTIKQSDTQETGHLATMR